MTSNAEVWTELGLDPTDDVRAIRKAYSQRLKTINVDLDPSAFIALRQAFDRALALAARQSHAPPRPARGRDTSDIDPSPPTAPAAPLVLRRRRQILVHSEHDNAGQPKQAEPVAALDVDRRDIAILNALLAGAQDIAVAHDEMLDLTRRILAQPALERVDRAAEIEGWFAAKIAKTIPRSDVIATLAIDHFNWRDQASTLHQSPSIRTVLQRETDRAFLLKIAAKHHGWNRAYRELTTTPWVDRRHVGWPLGTHVRLLLDTARADHPTLFRDFNPKAVSWWETRLSEPSLFERIWSKVGERLPGGAKVWNKPGLQNLNPKLTALLIFSPPAALMAMFNGNFSARLKLVGFLWLLIWLFIIYLFFIFGFTNVAPVILIVLFSLSLLRRLGRPVRPRRYRRGR